MNRNTLYAVIGLGLIAAVVVYFIYDRQHSSGIDVKVNDSGVSIETH